MGEITGFEDYLQKKEEDRDVITENEKAVQAINDAEERWNKRFQEKYKDVLAAAPDMPVPRIQYFCQILMDMIPALENVRPDYEWRHVMDEFSEFYLGYVEGTLSDWIDMDEDVYKRYDALTASVPLYRPAEEDSIQEFKNILTYILSSRPDRQDIKYRILLGTRMLFPAYEGIFDLEYEIMQKMWGRE